jgi:hypothetical protein
MNLDSVLEFLNNLWGWYDNPMPESTLSTLSGTMNLDFVLEFLNNLWGLGTV